MSATATWSGLLPSFRRFLFGESRAQSIAGPGPQRIDDPRYIFGTGISDDYSGQDLSEADVLGWPAVWQALRMISWSIAMMPIQVYERGSTAGAKKLTPIDDHPVQYVLQVEPHPEFTPFEIKAGRIFNAAFRGNGFNQVLRAKSGELAGLFPLDTHRMRVERIRGQRWYLYDDAGGKTVMFPMDEILHTSGFGDGGVLGLAISSISRTTFGKAIAMDRFGARVFAQGAAGNVVVESTQPYKWDTDAAKKEFFDKLSDTISGPANWHKAIGLPYGMTIKTLGISAKEAQLVEGLLYQVQDVARLTGVPPSLLMDNSHNTFTNSEQQFLQFLTMGLGPWMKNDEERMAKTLLSADERKRLIIKYNPDALLRTDIKTRFEAYRVAVGRPFFSPNEVRDLEDRLPVEGGDIIMEPLNMGAPGGNPADSGGGDAPQPDGDSGTRNLPACRCSYCTDAQLYDRPEYRNAGRPGYLTAERRHELRDLMRERLTLRRAFRGQIKRDAARLVRGEVREITRLVEKFTTERANDDLAEAIRRYYEGAGSRSFAAAVENIMGPTFASYAEAMADAVAREMNQDPPNVGDFLREYLAAFTKRVAGSHNGQMKKIIEENPDAVAETIGKRLEEWEDEPASQADKIGSRESVQLGEAIALNAFVLFRVEKVAWVASASACPLCQELDGKTVGVEEYFSEPMSVIDPGVEGKAPLTTYRGTTNPPLHKGCECSLAAA